MSTEGTRHPGFHVECISAILSVKDISASVKFYKEVLGFSSAAWGNENFTSINRDHTGIYLCKNGQGSPGTWIWIGFGGDMDRLHEEMQTKKVTIVLPPTNYSWALEMQILDPDGHTLRLGTDPDPGKPFVDQQPDYGSHQ